MSYHFEDLRSVLSGIETIEGSLRRSNALEVEARNRMLEVWNGLKDFVSIAQVLIYWLFYNFNWLVATNIFKDLTFE